MNKDKQTSSCFLQQFPLFRDLNEQEMAQVEKMSIQRYFPKKSVIFTEGSEKEAVFFVKDGLVKTFKTAETGQEQIVSFLKTGDMFPHIGFFHTDPYPATAEAIVDTHLLAIPIHLFEQLLLNIPAISVKLLRVMGAKIKELQETLQELTGQDVNQRAISFLLKLAEQHGEKNGTAISITFPITHQEFANAVGTTRETISRWLIQLRKEGIIHTDRARMTIRDVEVLQDWKGVPSISRS